MQSSGTHAPGRSPTIPTSYTRGRRALSERLAPPRARTGDAAARRHAARPSTERLAPPPARGGGDAAALDAHLLAILYQPPARRLVVHRSDDGDTRPTATTTSYTTSSCDRERVRRVRCVRDTYRESEACDPLPTGEGEVEEDCTMASPVHVCRASASVVTTPRRR